MAQEPSVPAPGAEPQMPATNPIEVPTDLLRASPSGITSETVGLRAAQTSFTAKAAEENLRGAAARVDQAWAAFLPRLTGTARYTRLSDFTPPSLGAGNVNFVGTNAPANTLNPSPTFAVPLNFTFPLVLDNYLLQATIAVPISDYFLRINRAYTAATNAQQAFRYDAVAARAKSAADGKAAFYGWLRARGAVVVAAQALNDQRTHLRDANNQFSVGNASRADVLRAETAVSAAELQVERSKNLAALTEAQVRVAVHASDEEQLVPGENLEAPPAPFPGNLAELMREALANRFEIKSIDANAEAAKLQAKVSKAGAYPSVGAFADGIYANPNQRKFPQTNEWFPTWDLGAQLVWSPNDVVTSGAAGADAESRAAAIEAQRGATRDGIVLEVTQAYQAVRESDVAIESTKRQIASATEAYRVARELFNNGRATSTTLTDAETELTRSRLDVLNAAADARTARVRLDHALGRDTKLAGN